MDVPHPAQEVFLVPLGVIHVHTPPQRWPLMVSPSLLSMGLTGRLNDIAEVAACLQLIFFLM